MFTVLWVATGICIGAACTLNVLVPVMLDCSSSSVFCLPLNKVILIGVEGDSFSGVSWIASLVFWFAAITTGTICRFGFWAGWFSSAKLILFSCLSVCVVVTLKFSAFIPIWSTGSGESMSRFSVAVFPIVAWSICDVWSCVVSVAA